VTPVFNTHRQVREYNERLYEPAAAKKAELSAGKCAKSTEVSQWKDRMRSLWPQVGIHDVHVANQDRGNVTVGESLDISARVHLGDLETKYVKVQAYFGEAENNHIARPTIIDLTDCQKLEHGNYLYRGSIPASESGAYGFNVRVIPLNPVLTQAHELRLITWAK
jgi:starch phosphorylase